MMDVRGPYAACRARRIRTAVRCGALALLLCGAGPSRAAPPSPADQQLAFRAALQAVRPSIVRIETIGGAQPVQSSERGEERVVEARFRQADGPTTGVLWSTDGLIVTSSFNFIRDPSVITVTLHDGRRFVARLLARDAPARIAVLKIDAADLPAARTRPVSALRVGQWALTAGFGHATTDPAVSVGVISALQRTNGLTVQTDAKTSPANYGGPLFDLDGAVCGVCVPMGQGGDEQAGVEWYDSGIGFAASVDRIERHLPALAAGRSVVRGFLGVALAPREVRFEPSTAEAVKAASGMRVGPNPRDPAAAAGLAEGDVITHLDEEPTPRMAELRRALWARAAGESVRVRYVREGALHEALLTLVPQSAFAQAPPDAAEPKREPAEPKRADDDRPSEPGAP
ncbi:MAG: trypsin-like peptidase domain-containing protein [Phycisphaerales bacterium]|nr:trypsin-like peptidase domain-containing protein [Phycisphaerales bacterium]